MKCTLAAWMLRNAARTRVRLQSTTVNSRRNLEADTFFFLQRERSAVWPDAGQLQHDVSADLTARDPRA